MNFPDARDLQASFHARSVSGAEHIYALSFGHHPWSRTHLQESALDSGSNPGLPMSPSNRDAGEKGKLAAGGSAG